MKLIALVGRHGSTVLNEEDCFRSWVDVPLSPEGVEQARAARDFLKKYKLKHILSSPLDRAYTTACICAQPHDLPVCQTRGLFPWRLGVFSGLPKDPNQDALRLFVKNPTVAPPTGESLEDFEVRQFQFWKTALETARSTGLTLFDCHTSNVTALVNFTEGAESVEPEFGDSVKPGGVAEILWDGKHYHVEPVFGDEEKAAFGGS